nr:MAG TPA: hypothetical protein [Bacteriophage sp.]
MDEEKIKSTPPTGGSQALFPSTTGAWRGLWPLPRWATTGRMIKSSPSVPNSFPDGSRTAPCGNWCRQ